MYIYYNNNNSNFNTIKKRMSYLYRKIIFLQFYANNLLFKFLFYLKFHKNYKIKSFTYLFF